MTTHLLTSLQKVSFQLKNQIFDVRRCSLSSGNSLFSEVEDRRQEVEKQLKKYKAKLEEFKIQYDKKVCKNKVKKF